MDLHITIDFTMSPEIPLPDEVADSQMEDNALILPNDEFMSQTQDNPKIPPNETHHFPNTAQEPPNQIPIPLSDPYEDFQLFGGETCICANLDSISPGAGPGRCVVHDLAPEAPVQQGRKARRPSWSLRRWLSERSNAFINLPERLERGKRKWVGNEVGRTERGKMEPDEDSAAKGANPDGGREGHEERESGQTGFGGAGTSYVIGRGPP